MLSSLDCNLGILCGSLPEIRVLFSFFSAKTASSICTTIHLKHHYKPPAATSSTQQRGPGRQKPAPGGGTGKKRKAGELAPNAYDLEKSIRPPGLSDEELLDDEEDDGRVVSIQVMLDESVLRDQEVVSRSSGDMEKGHVPSTTVFETPVSRWESRGRKDDEVS